MLLELFSYSRLRWVAGPELSNSKTLELDLCADRTHGGVIVRSIPIKPYIVSLDPLSTRPHADRT